MKTKYIYPFWIILLISLTSCLSNNEQSENSPNDFLLGGIQVNSPDQNQWMTVLKDAGMNTVSITVYARHYYWNHNLFLSDSLQIPNVIHEIKIAKANNMKVVFIPRVLLDHFFDKNRFLWHGMILPEPDIIQDWFVSYTNYVNQWAEICEKHDVDVFAIGSELRILSQTQKIKKLPKLESYYLNPNEQQQYIDDRMAFKDDIPPENLWVRSEDVNYEELENYLKDEVAAKVKWAEEVAYGGDIAKINTRRALLLDYWSTLIKTVRESYSGKLTYAANFDNYQNIAFWDQLDYIGINAYFPLRNSIAPATIAQKYTEMEDSWNHIFQNIVNFQKKNDLKLPLFFTELGYISKENCTLMPWQGSGFSIYKSNSKRDLIVWDKQASDFEERAAAIKALRIVNQRYDYILKGILYWKLSTDPHHEEIEPFLMLLDQNHIDPMQLELLEFMD